jgi:murein DD-endopeptidase MepM/ murein hydrolase activator NlpD
MDWRGPFIVVLAAFGLQGCQRQAPTTVVLAPQPSLPDHPTLRPGAEAQPPAPAAPAGPAAQPPARDLPAVPDTGDRQGAELLAQHALQVPVLGIAPVRLSDNYRQGRAGHMHEAIDILAPAGTPVVATDDGRVAKLFTSREGGLTVYQFDREGRLAYYYAHLQSYAPGLHEGMELRRGEMLGLVGSTGNADPKAPHLHFAVFRLGTPARWWEGEAVNPYPALRGAAPTGQVASR